ncbi:aminotransferase class V-fold PLP-dependent enzyme [Zongyangia hominis]|uniref:Aminotransferase class V-fold PLP-dependent enzyme n=1 Tax=Zongyangia hominis TaxID=2763677 RepID=A0A926IAZ9_9FIRM|nr:aminotransferase class V-fold PLP-dependent enzyme [Zongyangia hominis]MBC8570721.1 aminotransferase class V-fold PLP-dependent enzyme [Zongyangia hominis]
MNLQKLRSDTPCENVYLNHVSTSVPPKQVLEAMNEYFSIAVQYGSTSAKAQEMTAERFNRASHSIASLIGAHDDEILFVPNGSQAIGMVVAGLRVAPGDNVVVDEMSFISNVAPFLRLKELYGLEVRFAPAKLPGLVDLDAMENLIDGRTKMVALCHMANNLGMVQPAAAVGKLARAAGTLYLLDAANTAGIVPIDVDEIGCDFLAVSGRKYLRGPAGSAFLYARSSRVDEIEPVFATWNNGLWDWRENDWDWSKNRFTPHKGIDRLNFGEVNFPAAFGLGRAVEYIEEIGGVPAIKERVDLLLDRMIAGMRKLPDVEVYGSPDASQHGGMIGFNVKGIPFDALGRYINANNVGIMAHSFYSPGVLKLFGIQGVARYCVHCWNTEEEIDYAVSLLEPEKLARLRGESGQ